MSERLNQLQEFREEHPEDPFLQYAIATELLKLGRVAEGLQAFEALLAQFPSYQGTYYHLGKAYESQGRTEDAIQLYESGMQLAQKTGDRHAYNELHTALQFARGGEDPFADEDDDEEDDDFG